MAQLRWLLAGCLIACHAAPDPAAPGPVAPAPAAPASSREPQPACAPALPLLARQHTPNVTAIYVANLGVSRDAIQVDAPALLTSKRGYVHQPAFAADGSGVYFTWRPEGSQADIWFHDLRSHDEHPVTCSSEEEYLATPTPDGTGLTVVRVNQDLGRTLTVLAPDGKPRRTLFPGVTNVGAYRWADDHTVAMLLFSDGSSKIVLGDTSTGTITDVAENAGASLTAIPGARAIAYIDNSGEHASLMRLELATHATARLLALPDAVDSVAWLSDGSVLAGTGTRILRASPTAPDWHEVANLTGKIDGAIARLVISNDQRQLAIVVRLGD